MVAILSSFNLKYHNSDSVLFRTQVLSNVPPGVNAPGDLGADTQVRPYKESGLRRARTLSICRRQSIEGQ